MTSTIYKIAPDPSSLSFEAIISNLPSGNHVLHIELGGKYVDGGAVSEGLRGFEGIELLRWLRVKGLKNHCILSGFVSRDELFELIKKDIRKAIVLTEGTTYVQLPNNKIEVNYPENADEDQLKALFRAEIDLREIRHDEANTYGLRKLQEHHLRLEPGVRFGTRSANGELIQDIISYVFSTKGGSPSDTELKQAKQKLSALRGLPVKSIIYIDDKAREGWSDFFRTVVGPCAFEEIVPTAVETPDSLLNKINEIINRNGGWVKFVNSNHSVIIDLKLLEKEREVTNYKQLLCYKTLAKLRPVNSKGETDTRLRVMYFTASNDLTKVKGLLDHKVLNPHLIFTKEGADQMLTPDASFRKYIELLDSLLKLLSPSPKKKLLENLQIINLDEEEEKLQLTHRYLKLLYEEQLFGSPSKKTAFDRDVNEAEEIYIDTNFFLAPSFAEPLISMLIANSDRVRIPATVRHELKGIGENNKQRRGLEEISAEFFGQFIDKLGIKIVEDGLTPAQSYKIEHREFDYKQDFADEHIAHLMGTSKPRTVLLTDDKALIAAVGSKAIIKRSLRTPPAKAAVRQTSTPAKSPSKRGQQTQAPAGRKFTIGTVKLSKNKTSYVFLSDDKKLSLSIEINRVAGKTLEALQTLLGKTIKTTTTPDEISRMLA